jgi:acetyltransferase
MIAIERLDATRAEVALAELVELLRDSVDGGASVGFLPPLGEGEAARYWAGVLADVAAGGRVLLLARDEGRAVGTAQLELMAKPNASHRAEVQKVLVHSTARRRGVGAALMAAIEAAALAAGRTLLVLDTVAGDDGERLYRRLGYIEAGRVPAYARSARGDLDPTVIFYKLLTPEPPASGG